MKTERFDKKLFKQEVINNLKTQFRVELDNATQQQIYQAVAYALKEWIIEDWMDTQKTYEEKDPKILYYMSMEFLMGRALGNNLINMSMYGEVKEALEELAKIANIDLDTYGIEMLKAGTDLDDFSEEELINLDAKKFEENGVKCVIAQVNTVSIEDVLKRKEKLEEAINNEIEKDNLNLFVFAITDILNSNSQIIALGNRTDIIEKSYKLEDNMAFLKGVVSRKKQILPMVEKNI